jgi:hypothetical protein
MSIWSSIKSIFESNKSQVVAQIETLVNAELPTLLPALNTVAAKVLTEAGVTLPDEVVSALVSKIAAATVAELEAYVNSKI